MSKPQISPERHTPPGGDLRLPTPPGVIRRFWARHPWLADSIVAGLYFLPTTIALLAALSVGVVSGPLEVLLDAVLISVASAALLFRRRRPVLVLAITWLGLAFGFQAESQNGFIPVVIALYSVAVYVSVRSAWIGLAASVLVGVIGAVINQQVPGEPWPAVSIQYAAALLIATLVGINIGNRKRYVAAIIDRAAQLARERDQQAQLARITERSRIAREMHDIIAHSLSVIVALADGADAIAVKDQERSRAAMREVAQTGRNSLAEMRRLLGVLSDEPSTASSAADTAVDAASPGSLAVEGGEAAASVIEPELLGPQPGTDELADLVESFRSAGLPTRLETTGRMPENPGIQLTIYRIVQESLTNALRYADQPTQVTVRVLAEDNDVTVTVADDGRRRSNPPSQGSGRGLIGLRERVALYGGTIEAGPSRGSGWLVQAALHIEDAERTDDEQREGESGE